MASSFLNGKRILVTRSKEQAKAFSRKIEELKGVPIEFPLIKIQALRETEIIERTLQQIETFDWIVLTSVNGVEYFCKFLQQYNISLQSLTTRSKIAVVGKKTLQALEKEGITADVMPNEYVAESLFESLDEVVLPNQKVLLARGNLGRSYLPEQLTELGIVVEDLVIYETVPYHEKQSELFDIIKNKEVDIITFTSPSTVTNFVQLLKGTDWEQYISHILIACIGPITEKMAIELGFTPHIVASEYTVDGLLEAMNNYALL